VSQRITRHWYKFGVELEGGWDNKPNNIISDGSVYVCANYVGEIPSKPLCNLSYFKKWLHANFPNRYDRSCGYHVHVSFPNWAYTCLCSKKFFDLFLKETINYINNNITHSYDKESFKDRLNNHSQWCEQRYNPLAQFYERFKSGERYTAINYCYELHKTIEFRIAPMMTENNCYEWVKFILKVCNEFLNNELLHLHKNPDSQHRNIFFNENSENPEIKEDTITLAIEERKEICV